MNLKKLFGLMLVLAWGHSLPLIAQQYTVEEFVYDVAIGNTGWAGHYGINDNIGYPRRVEWLDKLFSQAEQGKLPIYDTPDFTTQLNPDFITQYLYRYDTTYVLDPVTLDEQVTTCKTFIGYGGIRQIRFREQWILSADSLIKRQVIAIAPLIETGYGKEKKTYPLFWLKPQNGMDTITITPQIEYTVKLKDHRALLVEWFGQILIKAKDGSLVTHYSDSLSFIPMNLEGIKDLLEGTDSLAGPDPTTIEDTLVPVHWTYDPAHIVGIVFREEWVVDKNNIINKKIIAIAPLVESIDEQGNYYGDHPLFWLKP